MNRISSFVSIALCSFTLLRAADTLPLSSPLNFQVIQRASKSAGTIIISGKIVSSKTPTFEAKLGTEAKPGDWNKLDATIQDGAFNTKLEAPAGGWYRLDLRASTDGNIIAESFVEHVGIGDIFVVTGQSNSANHGAEKQTTKSGRVATFTGKIWQLANDPQPGASGGNGSFMPPFGDEMVKRLDIPIGFIACGIGATSVREWLPKGTTFPNPPTIMSRVEKLPSGEWASKGQAYDAFINRIKPLGPNGFRAVLWHQGESDANQRDTTRTLAGKLYREYLEKLIRDSRKDIGWDATWFVAQVSYHVPGDEASPDIRDAQASLWKDGIALEGPDSDALKSEFREGNGKGVHFSGPGLREHAARWAEKVAPWIDKSVK
ncbi:MAG: sialate O-acetylesterase [Planctomycetota bacterium]